MKKFMIFSVAAIALFVTAGSVSAVYLSDIYTAESGYLKVGSGMGAKMSQNSNVKAAQMALNACVSGSSLALDGKFGPLTKGVFMSFQASKGIKVDGVIGPVTAAQLAACSGGSTVSTIPGCGAGAMFSSTTGAACSGATTTSPSASEGYLADISSDSTNRVSTVYESEQDKVVVGVRATARLADQTISRVTVKFHNNDTSGSSVNLAKYISSVSLWNGSTKIGTMAVADASRDNSTDTYTFQFTGINSVIAKDQIGRLYVSVSANGSLDSNDTAYANWFVTIPTDGIRATSPNGVYATASMSAINIGADTANAGGLSFGKFSANGVKAEITVSANNPAAAVVAVNNTSATNGVELLRFKIKATNSALTLRKIPVQITVSSGTAADDVTNVINTLKLMSGGNVIDTVDGSAGYQFTAGNASDFSGTACTDSASANDDTCAFAFSNLSNPYNMIASGATAEFSVVADFKAQSNYGTGTTVTAALANADALLTANFSVNDANGDQLTAGATYRVGGAVGNVMTLRVNGLQVAVGNATISKTVRGGNTAYSGDIIRATYSIPVTLQSFGQTLYVGQGAIYAAAATGTTTTAKALGFGIEKASAPTTTVNSGALDTNVSVASSLPTFTCSAPTEGTYDAYRIDSGATPVNCTLTVTLTNTGAGATAATESYRVQLNDVRFFTSNDLTAGAANQSLLPTSSYQTDYATSVSTSA